MSIIETLIAKKAIIAMGGAGLAVLLIAGIGTLTTVKKVSPVSWGWYGAVNETSGVALGGYDVVSYHDGREAKGLSNHSAEYNGSTWHFETAEHRDQFAAEPGRFAPAYGGFCAFAVSKGFTAVTEPNAFHIEADTLYFFADTAMRDNWLADKSAAMAAGQSNWAARAQ